MNRRGAEQFFRYARARHEIYLRRAAGRPREEWTKDPILQQYRFTNVFRELDRTTAWFREHVRDPMRNDPKVLLATVVFRLLNRISVGEAVFCQKDIEADCAFDLFLRDGKVQHLKRAIIANCGSGPYVTGAYIISSPPGYSKLDGMMEVIRRFADKDKAWCAMVGVMRGGAGLEYSWEWLRRYDYFGTFHSYEIVTDLRHTALLERAPDVMTWANIGPGCRRGLNRVLYGEKTSPSGKMRTEQCLEEMAELLSYSRDARMWPQWDDHLGRYACEQRVGEDMSLMQCVHPQPEAWPEWEMRDVEHTLCEFDKYSRVKNGEGRPRGVFR